MAEVVNTTVKAAPVTDKLAAYNQVLKDATPKGTATDPYNLANPSGNGAKSHIEETANCYLISAPGHYCIPLVYGNAIKNGITNTNSYQTSNSGTYILQHFKDHAGQDINNPWIEKTNSGANYGVDDAKVVWADEAGLVQFGATKIVRDASNKAFVQFEVPANKIKNGNAVIAVMKNGTVVWSWHLWFIHDDALNTVTCTNFQGHEYKFTQETLGRKYTAWSGSTYSAPRKVRVKVEQTVANGGVKQSAYITITQNPGNTREGYSTLYQFGRKDAFPATDAGLVGTFNHNAGDNMSIQNGIQHPENFYTDGSSWSSNPPAGYSYYNLWSTKNTTTGFNDDAVVKTIYDPCPAGFKMPASNASTGFTTTGNDTFTRTEFNVSGAWDNGWNFNNKISSPDATVYFPALGFRRSTDGSLILVGVGGYYWSAVPYGPGFGCIMMEFSLFNVHPQGSNVRAEGRAVRPVAEPKTRMTPKTPGSTEEQWGSEQQVGGTEIDLDN